MSYIDTKRIFESKSEFRRSKMLKNKERGNPNGKPFGQKPKDNMNDYVWVDDDDWFGGARFASRKQVDHSADPIRRRFMTSPRMVHRIFNCRACLEASYDTTSMDRAKVERQRKEAKKITSDMWDI